MVELTLAGVMTLLKRAPSWEESKKALSDASFMDKLLHYDRDHMDDLLLKRISKLTSNPDFAPEVGTHSCPRFLQHIPDMPNAIKMRPLSLFNTPSNKLLPFIILMSLQNSSQSITY